MHCVRKAAQIVNTMYYFILLCVAVLLRTCVALNGCNETCSSILAVKGSGNFSNDCNAGVTGEFFKCISALRSCDDVSKARVAEQSIAKYYQGITTGQERTVCLLSCLCNKYLCSCVVVMCWAKRDANETIPNIPLATCSNTGQCVCNNKSKLLAN